MLGQVFYVYIRPDEEDVLFVCLDRLPDTLHVRLGHEVLWRVIKSMI